MTTNQAVELAKKKDAGTITPDERTQLAAWIDQATDQEYDAFYFACYQYLESAAEAPGEQLSGSDRDPVVQYLDKHINAKEMEHPVFKMYRQHKTLWNAAAVLILCLIGAYLWVGRHSGNTVPLAVSFDTASAQLNFFAREDNKRADALDTVHLHSTELYTRIIRYDSLTLQALSRSPDGNREHVVDVPGVINVPAGKHYVVNMPDGSRIWLNGLSTLTVAPAYSHRNRSMELKGEGYFEVNGDARYPFIVKGGAATVQVLGTSFNMNCYADEPVQKVTLVEGSISVQDDRTTVQLKEKEQAVIGPEAPTVKTVDVDAAIAWKKGYIDFQNANLIDIFRTIERWYGLKINYQGMRPMQNYSCRISKNMELRFLPILLVGAGLRAEIQGNIMNVTPINTP